MGDPCPVAYHRGIKEAGLVGLMQLELALSAPMQQQTETPQSALPCIRYEGDACPVCGQYLEFVDWFDGEHQDCQAKEKPAPLP